MDNVEVVGRKTESVLLGGGLSLYKQPKRPGRGSPNWYARAIVEAGGRRVHVKSTGTTDQREAERRAHEFKTDLLIEQRTGGAYVGGRLADRRFRFDVITDDWLDHRLKLAGDNNRALRRVRDHRKIVTAPNGLNAFFRRTDVRTITGETVGEFIWFAEEGSRTGELRPTTKRNMLGTLRQILRFALDKRLIERVPTFPTIGMRDNPRPAFSEEEIGNLLKGAAELAEEARASGDLVSAAQFEELKDFIALMVASFLRSSEWSALRHKHIEVVRGAHPHLKIAVVSGKTKPRVTVTMPEAVEVYRRIVARDGSDPEAFLFMPNRANRETATQKMRDLFKAALKRTGLTFDPLGQKRVIHSLRHTALSLRLLNGDSVDLLLLSKNAGTSVQMLERFYCSDIDPAARIENLQSDRRKKQAIFFIPPLGPGEGQAFPQKSIMTLGSNRKAVEA